MISVFYRNRRGKPRAWAPKAICRFRAEDLWAAAQISELLGNVVSMT
jgi:hypothetical protein